MDLVGKAKRIRIYVNEGDKIGHQPASIAIVDWLRHEGSRGATLFRGTSGFGARGELHSLRLVDTPQDLPLVVEWIDASEVVERLWPRLRPLLPRGLVTMEEVDLLLNRSHLVRDLPTTLTAADVMSHEVAAVAPATPLREVVERMLGKIYRAVPVVEGGAPVGIITNSDLVRRGGLRVRLDLLKRLEPSVIHETLEHLASTNKVSADIMTPRPTLVDAALPLQRVAEIMTNRRLKRLPVTDARGQLVGMISRLDLLRTVADGVDRKDVTPHEIGLLYDEPISRVMRTDIPLVHPDTPLSELFQAVVSTRLNRALVIDDDRHVVGLVTDAELLDRLTPSLRPGALRSLMLRLPFTVGKSETSAEQHARARRAADLMSQGVAITTEDTLLGDAIALMLKGGHKVLAITDGRGQLTGMVDRADVLHGLIRAE